MRAVSLAAPIFIGSSLKIIYDVALFMLFRHFRPPDELERFGPDVTRSQPADVSSSHRKGGISL